MRQDVGGTTTWNRLRQGFLMYTYRGVHQNIRNLLPKPKLPPSELNTWYNPIWLVYTRLCDNSNRMEKETARNRFSSCSTYTLIGVCTQHGASTHLANLKMRSGMVLFGLFGYTITYHSCSGWRLEEEACRINDPNTVSR